MTDKELLFLARETLDKRFFDTPDDDVETLKLINAQREELTAMIIKINRGWDF